MKPFVQRAQRQSRARTYVVCTSIQRKNSRFLCRIAKCRGKERERERDTEWVSFSVKTKMPGRRPLSSSQRASAAEAVPAFTLQVFREIFFFFRVYEIPCSNLNRRPLFSFLLQLFLLFGINRDACTHCVLRVLAPWIENWLRLLSLLRYFEKTCHSPLPKAVDEETVSWSSCCSCLGCLSPQWSAIFS